MARTLPANIRQGACLLQRLAAGSPRRQDDGVAQLGQREEVSAVQRQLNHLAVFDHVADLGRPGLQLRRGRADHDLFGHARHAERELEVQHAPDFERDAALPLTREPGKTHDDIPLSDAQRREVEAALGVGHSFDDRAAGVVRRRDRRAGEQGAGAVLDDRPYFTCIDLARYAGGAGQQEDG